MIGSTKLISRHSGPEAHGVRYHGEITDGINDFFKQNDIIATREGDRLFIEYVRPYGDDFDSIVMPGEWIIRVGEHVFVYDNGFIERNYEY